jgi:uncharacterized protein (UPF0261 family)
MATIAVLGALDTKGEEHQYIADLISGNGHQPLLIDVGTLDEPRVKPDVPRQALLEAAGIDLAGIVARRDRGEAMAAMAKAAPPYVARMVREGAVDGIIALGGTGGTAVATAVMRELPIGFPKVMVSTVASGNTSQYVGVKDIVMFPSIVDVSGLNRVSRKIFARAAGAICGMVNATVPAENQKPVIVASMFGNTTRCVEHARKILENSGYEVLVFHATGAGGRTMESLVQSGMVAGVLDITTTEWADELAGGILSAGPTRLETAAREGVPAIITPGCLDMVNFGPPETVPAKYNGRNFYQHNPQTTLMRTTPDECRQLGRIIAEKVNLSTGPVTVLVPRRAISVISASGQKFHDPAADQALFDALKSNLRRDIELKEFDLEINDPEFAEQCAETLLKNIAAKSK